MHVKQCPKTREGTESPGFFCRKVHWEDRQGPSEESAPFARSLSGLRARTRPAFPGRRGGRRGEMTSGGGGGEPRRCGRQGLSAAARALLRVGLRSVSRGRAVSAFCVRWAVRGLASQRAWRVPKVQPALARERGGGTCKGPGANVCPARDCWAQRLQGPAAGRVTARDVLRSYDIVP